MKKREPKVVAGWREWVVLPELKVPRIKAKLDTGARSSALHVSELESFDRDGQTWLRFEIHPRQRDSKLTVQAEMPAAGHRTIRSSSGHEQERWVIHTTLELGGRSWPIDLTLTSRDEMGFRLLLGRQALRPQYLVDPGKSFLLSSRKSESTP